MGAIDKITETALEEVLKKFKKLPDELKLLAKIDVANNLVRSFYSIPAKSGGLNRRDHVRNRVLDAIISGKSESEILEELRNEKHV